MRILEKQGEWVFAAMGCLTALASAEPKPGEVLPDTFPKFEKQGAIYAAAEAPDGGFFVMGDFTEVDGVPRPGLAKLDTSGSLDENFAPEVAPDVVEVKTLAPHDPREQTGFYWLDSKRSEKLIPLANGGVLVMGELGWELRDGEGGVDRGSLPEVARNGPLKATPLFEDSGRLFIKVPTESGTVFHAYFGGDLSRDFEFIPAIGTRKIWPDGRGKLWASFEDAPDSEVSAIFIRRLFPNGSPDPGFEPIARNASQGTITARSGLITSFGVSGHRFGGNSYYPVVQKIGATIFSPLDNMVIAQDHELPFGGYAGAFVFDAGLGFITVDYDLRHVIRKKEGETDPWFEIPLAGPELTAENPTETFSVLITKDRHLIVGGNRKLTSAGIPVASPDWHIARFSRSATINGFYQKVDGEILVFGDFDRVDRDRFAGMVSLTAQGVVNRDFQPDRDWRFTKQIHERTDGKLIVLSRRGFRDSENNLPRLALLHGDGRFFGLIDVILPQQKDDEEDIFDLIGFAVRSDGALVVNTRHPVTGWSIPLGGFGKTFILTPFNDSYDSRYFGYLSHHPSSVPLVLSDDRVVVEKKIIGINGTQSERLGFVGGDRLVALAEDSQGRVIFQRNLIWRTGFSELFRWVPGKGLDPFYDNLKLPLVSRASGTFLKSGKLLLTERPYSKTSVRYPWNPFSDSRIRRLMPTGRIDPTFSVEIPGTEEAIINATLPVGEEIWVGGNFNEIGGVPRNGLARLSSRDLKNFRDWMEAVVLDREVDKGPDDDPDGDGASNLAEYAAGTNPLDSAALPQIRWWENGWKLAMNPDTVDVSRRIEVSENLKVWRRAGEGEVDIEEVNLQFRWRITGKARYCRLVVSLDDRPE